MTTATPTSPVGAYPITCSGLSSPNYAISYIPGTLSVSVDQLTITANNATRAYGAANPPLNNVTYSGFVNGDTPAALSGALGCTTTATQSSSVATYPITCVGLSSPNYTISYIPGTLNITADPLTISASNQSRQYGAANPVLNGVTYSGFVNGDTPASLSGTLSRTTSATPASPVGTYPITCLGLSSTNYVISFVPGILTVTQAVVTITANNATKTFDSPNPTLGWTASGFVDGDTVSVLTTNPTCTTTATTTSLVGTYPITCSGAAAMNYSFSYVPGTLTVLAATCHYISLSLSPSSVAAGETITVTGHLMSCASTTQIVVEEFTLAGPLKPGTCGRDETVMFKTPPFPLPPKTSQSVSFPFRIPERSCAGNFTITATTLVNGTVVDTSTTALTVTTN